MYQENALVRQHVADGHDVLVVASTETLSRDGEIGYIQPSEYMGSDGARVIRIPYRRFLPHGVMKKFRAYPGVLDILRREQPDVILFHGLCSWELQTVRAYKASNPSVKFYADSHEDFNNSARTFASKQLLHRQYYKRVLHRALDDIEKVLCISVETMDFVHDFYEVPREKIEFYPLGGFVYEDAEYARIRELTREQYEVKDDQVLFVQSGKMDNSLRKVLNSLEAFSRLRDPNARLILAGRLHESVAEEAARMIALDERIRFVGWRAGDELRALLCAADVYLQPGTQSATMQMSICSRCAVILDDVPSHTPYLDGNGWLVGKQLGLDEALALAVADRELLRLMSSRSGEIALRLLDYRKLAARLFQ